jgi:hypothetical protein
MAGLLLMGLPVLAQPNLADPNSAKEVFRQDFEASWEEWKTTKIDEITEIQYYVNTGATNSASFTPWTAATGDWAKGPVRTDSIIPIYNGEMTVLDSGEKAKGNEEWGDDPDLYPGSTTIIEDAAHKTDLSQFGEADGGGTHYFQFTSDTIKKINSGNGAYSSNLAARYRRNLFVRLKPGDIEQNSSYRLTFYVKAKTLPGHEDYSATPTVYADVMRGYYHCEKPFSMGYISNDKTSHPYEYSNTFEYTKNNFYEDKDWDNWEKVTFMTYYTTDSIAEYFMFKDGYWWAEDGSWLWTKGSTAKDGSTLASDLRYIVQPNKYFVRLGFPADYTKYSLDNLSLTKSWIAGCEYYGDKMRVDFGYKNNLGELVAAEKKRSGVDQIELSPDNFQVWCLQKGKDPAEASSWFAMPMRSAEYHADGYMYLFTKFYELDGEEYAYQFGDYDKVLVSFQNPTDSKLQLKYTDTPFPKGNDSTWIKNGKIVPDFVNEVAVPNPTAKIWKGVYSKYDLPPVMTEAPYEEGSFGLEPVKEMKFKFSRKVLFDNKELSEKAIAYVNDERWNISYDPSNDSILVITRKTDAVLPAGDYTIELIQLFGNGTDQGANVLVHYNFGTISREVASLNDLKEYWSARWDTTANQDVECLPEGTALYVPDNNSSHPWGVGDGTTRDPNCRLYFFAGDYNRAFNLNSRGRSATASLYLGFEEGYEINLAKGAYSLNFGIVGINDKKETVVYIYPWDSEWDTKPQNITKMAGADKTMIAKFTPSNSVKEDIRTNSQTKTLDMLDQMTIQFDITTAGRYVVEIAFTGSFQWSGYNGILFTSPVITAKPPVSFVPVSSLNASVEAAAARIAAAQAQAYYAGTALTALIQKHRYYAPGGAFDGEKHNKPSEWTAAKEDLDKATKWVKERMDTIDALKTKIADAETKIAGLSEDYKKFDVTDKLQALVDSANAYDIPANLGKDIAALTDLIDKAMTAVDNRKAKNDQLATYIADAKKLYDAKEREDIAEYKVLGDTLTEAEAFDAVTAADEAVDAEALKVYKVTTLYDAKVGGYAAMAARNQEFQAIAKELEVDEVDIWAINDYVANADEDNDEIAEIYKAAVKYAIYSLLADDPDAAEDGIDVTPFIKNYMLYAINDKPYVDNRDLTLATGNDRNNDKAKGKNNPGSTLMWIGHNYGQDPLDKKIWVLMYDTAYAEVFPGWTVQSYITGGHSMATPDPTATGEYKYLRFGAPVFDGKLNLDWNSKAELKQTVTNLPAGYYELGVAAKMDANSSDYKTTFTATTKVADKDSVLSVSVTSDATKTVSIDSITVLDGTLNIDLVLGSNDGSSYADDFELIYLGGHSSINYKNEVAAAKADMESKIANRKTFVNAPKAAAGRVEFYNAGGMKVDAPKAGLYIKVENGVATKVFVK